MASSTTRAAALRAFTARRREVVEENVSANGGRTIAVVNVAMLATAILAMFSVLAYQDTLDTCESHPINLKTWFQGMFYLQCCCCVFFFLISIILAGVLGSQAAKSRMPPAPPSAPEPLPAPSFLDRCCLASLLAFSESIGVSLAFLLVAWCLLGLISVFKAGDDCAGGQVYFWCLVALILIETSCCHVGGMRHMHRQRKLQSHTETGQTVEATV